MPPKVKVTKENIVKCAVDLTRKSGEQSINARALATALNCSTQPIFSNFNAMDDLKNAVIESAYKLFLEFIKAEVESEKYPQYKAFGMAYIRFAREETELFKLLFMRNRTGEDISPSPDYEQSIKLIMHANSMSREKAELMHLEMWTCVHGIATMLATSYLTLDEELISNMISDVYQGVRARYISEG